MKVLVNSIVYDSTMTPILIKFDENEQEMFDGMKRFVSSPEDYTLEERVALINTDLDAFDELIQEAYIILSKTQPEIVDFTFYTDEVAVSERVKDLNKLAKSEEYWYITLFSNHRNSENDGGMRVEEGIYEHQCKECGVVFENMLQFDTTCGECELRKDEEDGRDNHQQSSI